VGLDIKLGKENPTKIREGRETPFLGVLRAHIVLLRTVKQLKIRSPRDGRFSRVSKSMKK
jgi:hypothetical protein